MTIRHLAIALAALVLGIPLLAMSFFLLPVLIPVLVVVPFCLAAYARRAKSDVAPARVIDPPGSIVSIGEHGIALLPQLRHQVSAVEQPRAA